MKKSRKSKKILNSNLKKSSREKAIFRHFKSLLFGLSFLTMLTTQTLNLYANIPGTEADPLISRSYLEQRLNQIAGGNLSDSVLNDIIQSVISHVIFQIENTPGLISFPTTPNESFQFIPIFLQAGTILIGDYGTELIIRGGNVIAYVYGHDGIINITTGQEHFGGEALAHNNLLLIPRHDARGIRILTDSWVMVRGNYFLR